MYRGRTTDKKVNDVILIILLPYYEVGVKQYRYYNVM